MLFLFEAFFVRSFTWSLKVREWSILTPSKVISLVVFIGSSPSTTTNFSFHSELAVDCRIAEHFAGEENSCSLPVSYPESHFLIEFDSFDLSSDCEMIQIHRIKGTLKVQCNSNCSCWSSLWLNPERTECVNTLSAVVVECLFLKPCWK